MPKLGGGGPPKPAARPAKPAAAGGAARGGVAGPSSAPAPSPVAVTEPPQNSASAAKSPLVASPSPADAPGNPLLPANGPSAAATAPDPPPGTGDALALRAVASSLRQRRVSAVLNDERLYLSYLLPLRALMSRMARSVEMASEGRLGTYFDDLVGDEAQFTALISDLREVERAFGSSGTAGRLGRAEEENELAVDVRVVLEGLVEMAAIKMDVDAENEQEEEDGEGSGEEDGDGEEDVEREAGDGAADCEPQESAPPLQQQEDEGKEEDGDEKAIGPASP
ncbi:hypothetical protein DFJ74DRAFT_653058 [Hyaloraphidium curvatum]|nr:hypothetical protein DFJ74DRAFT_653058 [Hyaloraphidium curvatum]